MTARNGRRFHAGWMPHAFLHNLATSEHSFRPHPRVLSDDVWAKLLWAGLNLADEDLPNNCGGHHHYPLSMIRAVTIVWLFAGLRQSEIRRLRVGWFDSTRRLRAPAQHRTKTSVFSISP